MMEMDTSIFRLSTPVFNNKLTKKKDGIRTKLKSCNIPSDDVMSCQSLRNLDSFHYILFTTCDGYLY